MCSVNGRASNLAYGMFAHKGTHRMAKFKHHRARNSNRMMAIWNVLLICYFIEIANNVALSIIAQSIEDNMGNKICSDHLMYMNGGGRVVVVYIPLFIIAHSVSRSRLRSRAHLHTHTLMCTTHRLLTRSHIYRLHGRSALPIHAG